MKNLTVLEQLSGYPEMIGNANSNELLSQKY